MRRLAIGICSQTRPDLGSRVCVHLYSGDLLFREVSRPVLGAKVFATRSGRLYTMARGR
jgi:hypothetical protein